MNSIHRFSRYLSLAGLLTAAFLSSPLLSSNTASADQHPPKKRGQKKDQPLELLGRLQSSSICGATESYRGPALVDMLSHEIANKVVSKYQGGNILFCEQDNDNTKPAKRPHARIFSESKMYQVSGSAGKTGSAGEDKYWLEITICPYTEYRGCATGCRPAGPFTLYRQFTDEDLNGTCDLIKSFWIGLGGLPHNNSYYRPSNDEDTKTKQRAQKAYEKLLRKVAKCYGIKE